MASGSTCCRRGPGGVQFLDEHGEDWLVDEMTQLGVVIEPSIAVRADPSGTDDIGVPGHDRFCQR